MTDETIVSENWAWGLEFKTHVHHEEARCLYEWEAPIVIRDNSNGDPESWRTSETNINLI